jgi:hypothetical protein
MILENKIKTIVMLTKLKDQMIIGTGEKLFEKKLNLIMQSFYLDLISMCFNLFNVSRTSAYNYQNNG